MSNVYVATYDLVSERLRWNNHAGIYTSLDAAKAAVQALFDEQLHWQDESSEAETYYTSLFYVTKTAWAIEHGVKLAECWIVQRELDAPVMRPMTMAEWKTSYEERIAIEEAERAYKRAMDESEAGGE